MIMRIIINDIDLKNVLLVSFSLGFKKMFRLHPVLR